MIIKVSRGNFFGGVVDYVTRQGKYAGTHDARVLEAPGLYGYRTFAAQLAYDAARNPPRTKPVVHLIARAERALTDAQYGELGDRMLKVAGLAGRAHIKVVHDEPGDGKDDGHLHLIVCEVDDEGNTPPRLFRDKLTRRDITADVAQSLPKDRVQSRAWDSHLAWKLTALAREVEVEWGLRQLSSKRASRSTNEPEISRAQQEHLARTGLIPLQDRFFKEVQSALALPTWDQRAAALAAHALVLRPYEAKGRVRGLMVQSINNSKDAVKISAFNMGGMGKLDATADMPFLSWHPEYRAAINLRKTEVEARDDHWRMTQRQFRLELQAWQIVQKRKDAAYRRYKQDRAQIVVQFELRLTGEPQKPLHRQIRAERSAELVRINTDRDFALIEAGPKSLKPNFADFVARRAGEGDAAAAEVYKDLLGKVSETRREAIAQHKLQIARLAAAARALRADAGRLRERLAGFAGGLRDSIAPVRAHAIRLQTEVSSRSRMAAAKVAKVARGLAEDLTKRLDQAGHRIRIAQGNVSIDRFQPGPDERALIANPGHVQIFQAVADRQSSEEQRVEAERRAAQIEQLEAMASMLAAHNRARQEAADAAANIRAKLIAASQAKPSDSRATGIYLKVWRSGVEALPAGQAFGPEQARAIEIDAIASLVKDEAGYDEAVIKRIVATRSPMISTAEQGAVFDQRAEELFGSARQRPDILRRVEENRVRASEMAERAHRFQVIDRMDAAADTASNSDRRWAALYGEILSQRPVDVAVDRAQFYHAIDYDVAGVLLREGESWSCVQRSMTRLSPSSPFNSDAGNPAKPTIADNKVRRAFEQYVEATLLDIIETLPVAARCEAERLAQNHHRRTVGMTPWAEADEQGMAPLEELPESPALRLRSVKDLSPAELSMLELAQPTRPEEDIGIKFFEPDGQPNAALRELLADVRRNHAQYHIGASGELLAPEWPAKDQESLALIQQHKGVQRLLLAAFQGDRGSAANVSRPGPEAGVEW